LNTQNTTSESDPKYAAQIDAAGWIFVAFVVVIAAIAAVVVSTL
jgi:hypothetical protein